MALNRDEQSPLFAPGVAGTLRLIVYLTLACVLMVLDHRGGWLSNVRYGLSIVVEPIYRIAGLPSQGFQAATVAFADRQRLTESNQRLREDLLLANAKLNRMASVAEQNQRLKELLDTQHSLSLNVQLARLIGVDLGPNLSVTGSLATILWLTAIRREGEHVGFRAFLKVGALVTPPALVLALGARLLLH